MNDDKHIAYQRFLDRCIVITLAFIAAGGLLYIAGLLACNG